MAKVQIELEQNEYSLYDYVARVDGFWVAEDGNFTTEEAAVSEAREKVSEWVTRKRTQ